MNNNDSNVPDSTAVRVALWRAIHVQVDALPHVLKDEVGLQLVNPPEGWRERPDMHPQFTSTFRASIVARARFIEDFVLNEMKNGIHQYVILGSGLDTFAQRHPEVLNNLKIFEIEKPETLEWKEKRLKECGYNIPANLKFVPVNFETHESWWEELKASGFDSMKVSIVTSIGVSMYLTMDAIKETLKQMTKLAPGSKFIMTFMLPLDMVDAQDQMGYQMALKGAQNSGTPFISFFSPSEMLKLAREIGFTKVEHRSTSDLTLYFTNRADGLRPSTGEELLIVTI